MNTASEYDFIAVGGGFAGLGLREGRINVPRGRMLGGSSGINHMAYVRGHPGDFDKWGNPRRGGHCMRWRNRHAAATDTLERASMAMFRARYRAMTFSRPSHCTSLTRCITSAGRAGSELSSTHG